jgi:hypothetical protein
MLHSCRQLRRKRAAVGLGVAFQSNFNSAMVGSLQLYGEPKWRDYEGLHAAKEGLSQTIHRSN